MYREMMQACRQMHKPIEKNPAENLEHTLRWNDKPITFTTPTNSTCALQMIFCNAARLTFPYQKRSSMAVSLHIPGEVLNFINGDFKVSASGKLDVVSPVDGKVISAVPLSAYEELDLAVQAARKAWPAWSALTLKERVQYIFRYRNLLLRDRESLAELVHVENGKTLDEARAEVDKSIELCEFACSMPQIVASEVQERYAAAQASAASMHLVHSFLT